MFRPLAVALAAALLVTGLALAEPRVEVRYHSGVPQLLLSGDWSRSRYTVYRASERQGLFTPITTLDVLCLGSCYADDYDALPGRTYWYRFDIVPADGNPVSFGPYAVTISPVLARRLGADVSPNPSRGAARIDLFLAGRPGEPPLGAEAVLLDLQGRRVRTLFRGALARGKTTLRWDGRDDAGLELAAGHYFLRFSSPLGSTVARLVRVQ